MMLAELGTYRGVESSPFIPLEKRKSPVLGFVSESTHVARKRGKQKQPTPSHPSRAPASSASSLTPKSFLLPHVLQRRAPPDALEGDSAGA